jgi:hypothetical protein
LKRRQTPTEGGPRDGAIIADLHVGSIAGLCPPENFASAKHAKKIRAAQEEAYTHYEKFAKDNRGIDILLINGDCIEGKGRKSGGNELWTADLLEQAEVAAELIAMFKPGKIRMSYGTNYHVAADSGERIEKVIADMAQGTIHNRKFMNIGGCVVDMRHFVESSSIPHSRMTAIARQAMWNAMLHERGKFPKVDVICRSHVHYHVYGGDVRYLGFTTPCLQLPFTQFGGCKCSGDIDWGIIKFHAEGGKFSWESQIVNLETAKVTVEQV